MKLLICISVDDSFQGTSRFKVFHTFSPRRAVEDPKEDSRKNGSEIWKNRDSGMPVWQFFHSLPFCSLRDIS